MSSDSPPKLKALSRDAAFWDSQVEVYERLTGGCTRIIAAEIAKTITPPITASSYILDNACGTGVFTEEVKARIPDAHIMAADIAPGMAKKVEGLATKRGWTHVETSVQDMRELNKFGDETFSHVVTGFALVMLKEQDDLVKATREMYRVLQDGGVCVVTSWAEHVYTMPFLATQKIMRPDSAPQLGFPVKGPILSSSFVQKLLINGGFEEHKVAVKRSNTHMTANSLDDLVDNLMVGKVVLTPDYSDEELEDFVPILKREMVKLDGYKDFGDHVEIHGMKAWIASAWK